MISSHLVGEGNSEIRNLDAIIFIFLKLLCHEDTTLALSKKTTNLKKKEKSKCVSLQHSAVSVKFTAQVFFKKDYSRRKI